MSHTKYICIKCNNFSTINYIDIKKHCLRKNSCTKRSDIILLSDDQILVLNLMPYHNNVHSIDINELNHLSNSNIITENKLELFYELDYIKNNKIRTCKYCYNEFTTINDIKKHVITQCFYQELLKRNKQNSEQKNTVILDSCNIIDNSTNNTNCNITNNSNNNYNLYFNLPIPFDEDWDISEISKSDKDGIMISQYVFSKLLNEILKNEKNSNVIIDKDNETGMVYIDHTNKYIEMKGKDIIMKTMEKLYDHLHEIIENNKDSTKTVKEFSKDFIHDKFNKYCKDKETKKAIDEVIYESYDNNLKNAKTMSENVKSMNNIIVNPKNLTKQSIDKDMCSRVNANNIKNKKTPKKEKKDRTEFVDKKTRVDKLLNCCDEDMYYLYDSDGNTKA